MISELTIFSIPRRTYRRQHKKLQFSNKIILLFSCPQAHELFFMPVSAERITATAIFEYWSGADGSAEQEENAVDGSDGSSSQMLVTSEPHQTSNPVHRKDITLVGSAVEPEIKVCQKIRKSTPLPGNIF